MYIHKYRFKNCQIIRYNIRQVKQGLETTRFRIGFTLHSCYRVNMIALDLIITESSICLRDFSGIYEAQETDAFQKHKAIS